MGTISTFLNLALGQEDSFGKVLAGSTNKNAKVLWKEAGSEGLKGTKRFAKFVENASEQVGRFDRTMNLASDVFDKQTIKAMKQTAKTNKNFSTTMLNLFEKISKGEIKPDDIAAEVKKLINTDTAAKMANKLNVDDVAAKAAEKLVTKQSSGQIGKILASNADNVAVDAAKASKKGIFNSLKGKGGTIGIVLTVAFELPEIIKAFKNGDGVQQIGRSTLSVGGFAAGAAAGAAIGSVIPVAGTAIGAVVGGLAGIIGGMVGGAAANKAGEAIFGKSIAEQKEEQAEKQQEALAMMQKNQQVQTAYGVQPSLNLQSGEIPPLEEMLKMGNLNQQQFNTFA